MAQELLLNKKRKLEEAEEIKRNTQEEYNKKLGCVDIWGLEYVATATIRGVSNCHDTGLYHSFFSTLEGAAKHAKCMNDAKVSTDCFYLSVVKINGHRLYSRTDLDRFSVDHNAYIKDVVMKIATALERGCIDSTYTSIRGTKVKLENKNT